MHKLSELQGDDALVLMLGRGEHCPRERQHQYEMVKFAQWAPVAFTQMVTVLPGELHDVFKMKIATGAYWTYLCDADLEVRTSLEIDEYTDEHHDYATVPHTRAAGARPGGAQGLRGLLVLGTPDTAPALGGPWGTVRRHQGRLRPDDGQGPRGEWEAAASGGAGGRSVEIPRRPRARRPLRGTLVSPRGRATARLAAPFSGSLP